MKLFLGQSAFVGQGVQTTFDFVCQGGTRNFLAECWRYGDKKLFNFRSIAPFLRKTSRTTVRAARLPGVPVSRRSNILALPELPKALSNLTLIIISIA